MIKKTQNNDAWLLEVARTIKNFCRDYKVVYAVKKRERAASFEIGCLHMLLTNYEEVGSLKAENLNDEGEFRYLTTPSGNPENFSWIRLTINGEDYQIRQQVRIKSHWHDDIAFCPDIVVLKPNADIDAVVDEDFANGKRKFFSVRSDQVVSAHECKSLSPFPELLVSFIGMFQAAHRWFAPAMSRRYIAPRGIHPAPCLFIGGDSRSLQRRMIDALEETFPINIVSGLHFSRFKMSRHSGQAKYLDDAIINPPTINPMPNPRRLRRRITLQRPTPTVDSEPQPNC